MAKKSGSADNTAIGSALIIPDGLINELGKVDKKIKDIQDTSRATANVFNNSFASMSMGLKTGILTQLQQVINQLGQVGGAATTAANAANKIGGTGSNGLGAAAQQASKLGSSITGVTEQINRMYGGQVKNYEQWQAINNQISQLTARQNTLNSTVKTYQITLDNIKNGKGGIISQQQLQELKAAKEEMAVNQQLISTLRQKQQQLVANNQETQKQITFVQQLKNQARGSLADDRSAAVLKQMSAYYKELEKSSAQQAKQAQKEAQDFVRAEEQKQKAIQRTAQQQAKFEAQQRGQKQSMYSSLFSIGNATPKMALAEANNATSINQRAQAIKMLEAARAKLNTTDAQGKAQLEQLNAKIKELNAANRQAVASSQELNNSHRKLMDTAWQLQRAFALMFSVSQIRGYIDTIAKVRGEFELQQRSLEAILQNKTEADAIFNKTVALAVQSPFQIRELVSYTKQLAAYRIESDKLYDTTKRLADVSAGLGVDMQRLILAYGQVKAAAYLRGCLGYNTPIRMYDGSIKMVQDVQVGDVLINENGEKVNVKELIRGREKMYIINQLCGNNRTMYKVNANHILTLWNVAEQRLEDIYLYDYLKDTEQPYLGVKVQDNGERFYYAIEAIECGVDNYYGFVLDGNKRFLLGDGTITHNTEVRQFTEAGINLYGELQRYFQEVKGEAYTTAQIVDMISKRMVTFEDVGQIFKRITDQGGIFYRMQEIQAETLQGKIANFKDSVDVMMNEIGKDNEGLFKGAIDSATALLGHWEAVANVGKTLLGVLALVKMYSIQAGASMNAIFLANAKFASLKGANGLKMIALGFKNVGVAAKTAGLMIKSAFMANLPLVGLMVGYEVISSLISRYNEYSEAVRKTVTEYNKSMYALKELKAAYQDTASASDNASKKELSNAESKRKALEKLVEMMRKENLTIEFNVKDLSESEIEKYLDGSLERYEQFLNNKMKLDKLYDKNKRDTFFVDNIEEDAKDYENAASDLIAESDKIGEAIANLNAKYKELPESARIAFDELEKIKADDTNIENIEERIKKLQVIYSSLTMRTKGRTFAKIGWEDESSQIKHLIDLYKDAQRKKEELLTVKRVGNKYHYEGEFAKIAADLQTQYTKGIENGVKNGLTKAQARVQAANDVMAQITKLQAERGFSDLVADYLKKAGDYKFVLKVDKKETKKQVDTIDNIIQRTIGDKTYKIRIATSKTIFDKIADAVDDAGKVVDSLETWNKIINSKGGKELSWGYVTSEDPNFADWYKNIFAQKGSKYQKGLPDNVILNKSTLDAYSKYRQKLAQETLDTFNLTSKGQDKSAKKYAKEQRDILSEQIEAYKDLQSQYEKYLKIYDKETAKAKALESLRYKLQNAGIYKDAAGIVPDEKTIAGRIKNIAAKIKSIQKRGDAYKIVADFEYNIDKKDFDKKLEYIKADVEKAFNGLQLFKNLKGEGLSDVEIKSMFGNITNSFADVRKQIERSFASNFGADKNKWSKEVTEKYAEQMNKLDKQIYENSVSQFKELSKAYKDQLDERLKIDLWYAEERKKIEENEQLAKNPALKDEFIRNLDKQRAQKSDEADWKQFQNSDFYIRIFENLDTTSSRVLTAMKEKLASLRGSLKNLSPEQLKQVVDQIDKVDTQLVQRNPFKGLVSGIKDYIAFAKQRKQLETEYLQSIKKEAALQSQKDTQAKDVELANQRYELAVKIFGMYSYEAAEAKSVLKVEQDKLDVVLKELVAQGKITEDYANQIRNGEKQISQTKKRISELKAGVDELNGAWGDFSGMLENFGVEVPEEISGVMSGLSQTLEGLDHMDITRPFSIITGSIKAIAGIGNTIGSIFGFGNKDKKLQKEIEKQEKAITRLQRAYDKLKTAMDEAWSASDVIQANKDTKANIEQQIDAYEKMIKAEEDKKKTDKSKIEEWENKISDLKETLKELEEQTIETFGGIGESNYKSAAQEFADAWVDAFNATENTLDALNDTFDNYFYNMLKKQIMLRVAQKYLEPLFKAIDDAVYDKETDSLRGIEDMKNRLANIGELSESSLKQLDEALKVLFEAWNIKPSGTTGELSKLQQGIQSLTESTGQALESILNSIRFFVAQQTTDVSAIRALLQQSSSIEISASTDTPMLSELRAQTNILRSINANIERIIRPSGHPKSGAGVKVFID